MINDKYFFEICDVIKKQSSYLRAQVGAAIFCKDKAIITGYNTAPEVQKTCDDIGECYREKNNIKSGTQLEKCKAVGSHAECNAISSAAKYGIPIKDSTIYITGHDFVCDMCKAMIINSGIKKVILRNRSGEIKTYIPEKDWKLHSIDKE